MIESMTWHDARDTFFGLNEKLFSLIEKISPDDSFKLYKIRYPFGATILDHGTFCVPNPHGEIVPVTDHSIDKETCSDLLYNLNSNPVGMALVNTAEIYLEANSHTVIPYLKLMPGNLIGSWGVLDAMCNHRSYHPETIWNMSAGARSLFMLPKIGNKTFHKNMQREYSIQHPVPKTLREQWCVFKELIAKTSAAKSWYFEIIFFSKKWFSCLRDPLWQDFYTYLLEAAWCGSAYLRNQSFWNLIFSLVRKEQKLAPNSYINDIVKHLCGLACEKALGFAPAIDNTDAPISTIQDIYVNGSYKLKDYLPVLVAPRLLDRSRPVYYSLNNITAMEFSEYQNKRNNLFQSIEQVKKAVDAFIKGIRLSKLNLNSSHFYENLSNTTFEYFNDHVVPSSGIQPVKALFEQDKDFNKVLISTKNKLLPVKGNFVQACIKLSKKQDT